MTPRTTQRAPCGECLEGDVLREEALRLGAEIHVTTEPPLVASPWTEGMTCPGCKRTWFFEPTPEQRMTWTKDGTP